MRSARRREDLDARAVAAVLPWIGGEEDLRRRRTVRAALLFATLAHVVLLPLHLFPGRGAPVRSLNLDPERFRLAPTPAPRPPEPPAEPPPATVEPAPAAVRVPVPQPVEPEPIERPIAIPAVVVPRSDVPLATLAIPSSPPAVPEQVVDWTTEIERPTRLEGADPVYTECARRAHIEGVVVLEATIDRGGAVKSVDVLRGLTCGLDESATRAVSSWRFRPAMRDGVPLSVRYRLTVRFALR